MTNRWNPSHGYVSGTQIFKECIGTRSHVNDVVKVNIRLSMFIMNKANLNLISGLYIFSWFIAKLLFQLCILFICNCQKQYRKKIRISVLKGCAHVLHLLQVLFCWLTWQEITFYRCRYVQCHNNTSFTFLHVLFCSWSWRMPLCHVRMTFSLSVLMVY